jgi:small subunit ribosomal protein S3Ae
LKIPAIFETRTLGKTLVNRTQGLKNAEDYLRGRVVEMSLGDLNKDEAHSFRKMKFKVEEVQGNNCLMNFYGMDFTSDKIRSLVKKWQSLIDAHIDVSTTDGYIVRLFLIGFTKRRPDQVRKTTYAQSSQIRAIRKKMFDVVNKEAAGCDLKGLFEKLIPEVIGKEVEKVTQGIFPLQNVYVRKVKILKAPKMDLGRLLELHADTTPAATEEKGNAVPRNADFKEQVFTSV